MNASPHRDHDSGLADALHPYLTAAAPGSVLLAVSGGPDSTALLHAAARFRGERALHVATVDHRLRPESAAEAEMVGRLARDLGLVHAILDWEEPAEGPGIPAAARAARYRLLAAHAKAIGAATILTAHTADDQAETVLMRLIAGSGPAGLAGMRRERVLTIAPAGPRVPSALRGGVRGGGGAEGTAEASPAPSPPPTSGPQGGERPRQHRSASGTDGLPSVVLARPFLHLCKADLVAYCEDHGLPFARDPTNTDDRYARPRLRALLPLLAAEGVTVDRLCRLAERAERDDAALTVGADALLARAMRPTRDGALVLDGARLRTEPPALVLRAIDRALDIVRPDGAERRYSRLERLERLVLDDLLPAISAGRALRRTLRGVLIALAASADIHLSPAPPRRGPRPDNPGDRRVAGAADLLGKGLAAAYIGRERVE